MVVALICIVLDIPTYVCTLMDRYSDEYEDDLLEGGASTYAMPVQCTLLLVPVTSHAVCV